MPGGALGERVGAQVVLVYLDAQAGPLQRGHRAATASVYEAEHALVRSGLSVDPSASKYQAFSIAAR